MTLTRLPRIITLAFGATCVLLVAGCDDGGGSDSGSVVGEQGRDRAQQRPARPNGRPGSPAGKRGGVPTGSSVPTDSLRKVRTKSGAVILLPPKPTQTATAPQRGCQRTRFEGGGRDRIRLLPPAPGVSARRVGPAKVLVVYRFGAVEPRCRPASLELTVDVNDDRFAGDGTVVRVRLPRGEIPLSLPEHVAGADVLRATARTEAGLPSRVAIVLIR